MIEYVVKDKFIILNQSSIYFIMKKSVLQLCFLFVLVMFGFTLKAQKNVSFIAKWNASQVQADSIAQAFVKKYPDIKHYKVPFKRFHDKISNQEIVLDMFIEIPKGDGPFPVVILIHGGGFIGGDKSNFTFQTFALANKGIAGISIEYRLRGHGGDYPDFNEDVMDAIDFVRQNAAKYNLDFSKLGLGGGSAGGYLSALAAMRTPECKCFIGYNGLYDVAARALPESTEEAKKALSPILSIKNSPPATILFHGKDDTTVDCQQSVSFAKAIRDKGGKAEVILFDGQKHGFFNKEPYLTQTTDAMVKHVLSVFNPAGRTK